MPDKDVFDCPELNEAERSYLRQVQSGLPLAADVSRSDILIFQSCGDEIRVAAHALPYSVAPVYDHNRSHEVLSAEEAALFQRALRQQHYLTVQRQHRATEAPIVSTYWPLAPAGGRPVAVLAVEATQLAAARQHNRDILFQMAVNWLQEALRAGKFAPVNTHHPFSEGGGIILVDGQRYIRYLSGVAANIYRKMGYMGDLRGWRLADLQNVDNLMVVEASRGACCREEEVEERGRILVKQVIPLHHTPSWREWWQLTWKGWRRSRHADRPLGALILIHDLTDEQAAKRELAMKNTIIKEIHHRVKNNLQTVVSLLRMQARRLEQPEARQALQEAARRVQAVAVIHEFLSHSEGQSINVRDVCQRVISQIQEIVGHDQKIEMHFEGEPVFLSAQKATAIALVVNELLLNAAEHAFGEHQSGEIFIHLTDWGDRGELVIEDNGRGLPKDWQGIPQTSLGLQIVKSLSEHDLQGSFSLEQSENGTIARVIFTKGSAVSN